jgi:hypothetical protein
VRLTGSWSLLGAESESPITQRNIGIDAGPAETPDATAATMSRALGQLADQIASAL